MNTKNQYFIWSDVSAAGKTILKTHLNNILTFLKKHNIFKKPISSLEIAVFFRQLATLIAAGIPIVQSFEILIEGQEKISIKLLIHSLKQEIESGKNLAASLRKFPKYFDHFICHLIHIGEQSGTLEKMLNRVADHKEKSLAINSQIKQALFYPLFTLIVSIIVTVIMLTFIVPRFADLFKSMHTPLPVFTRTIIYISNCLHENYWLALLPITAGCIFFYYFKKSYSFKKRIDHTLLSTPFFKNILQKMILIRFTKSLATTYSAGVPMTEGLKMIERASSNDKYFQSLILLQTDVARGKQLHTSMGDIPFFPPMVVQMVKIGEESGTLEKMLEKIAELYGKDLDFLLSNLSRLLEPLIMIILGVLIGGLVIAMYLPVFKLGTLI